MSLHPDALGVDGARARNEWARESSREELVAPEPRRISIFGLGHVGAVSLACLARDGHEVIGVDTDTRKLGLLREGHAPIVETGIQELMQAVVRGGAVRVSDSVRDAILGTDISFVCIAAPAMPNGSQDLAAIRHIAEQIGSALPEKQTRHVIVIRSAVRPGTVHTVIRPALEASSGLTAGRDFSLCFQPEFLRGGTSVHDYDHPPLTVVGSDDEYAPEVLRGIFGHLPCEFIHTSVATAEMLKYACNAFHALKVTFANEIGRLSQGVGVDPHEVMQLLCMDRHLNISSAYLRPGFAFGGSCLPRDLQTLLHLARSSDVELPMLASILPSNAVHIEHAIGQVLSSARRSVGMIGLSFKAGADDLRRSPLVIMAERLIGKGLHVSIYDPKIDVARLDGASLDSGESMAHIGSLMTDDLVALVRNADVLVIAMKSAEVLATLAGHTRRDQLLLDLVGLADRDAHQAAYRGMCW